MFKFRSKVLFVSAVLASLYFMYLVSYFVGGTVNASSAEDMIGTGLATAIIAPHAFFVFLAAIFNWIGFALNKRWAAITCGVLYSVVAFVFLIYAIFVIPSIILSFVGVAKVSKIETSKNQDLASVA